LLEERRLAQPCERNEKFLHREVSDISQVKRMLRICRKWVENMNKRSDPNGSEVEIEDLRKSLRACECKAEDIRREQGARAEYFRSQHFPHALTHIFDISR